MHGLNWVDYLLLIGIGYSTILGFFKGIIRSLISLVFIVGGYFVASYYGPHLAPSFAGYTDNVAMRLGVSYAILFVGTLIIGFIVKLIVSMFIDMTGMGFPDRIFGTLFGIVRGYVILAALIFFLSLTPAIQSTSWKNSRLIPVLEYLVNWTQVNIPSVAKYMQKIKHGSDVIKQKTQDLHQTVESHGGLDQLKMLIPRHNNAK